MLRMLRPQRSLRRLAAPHLRCYTPEALQSRLPLDTFVKVDLLKQETPERVREIWLEHHAAAEDAVGDIVTPEQADAIATRCRAAPHFVLPVFRGEGFVNMLSNVVPGESRVMFSHLEDYKADPQSAPSQLTLAFYDDIAADLGLVLVRGDMSDVMQKSEAAQLLRLWTHFYTDDKSYEWVETFNLRPAEFDFDAYMKAFESLPKA
mmetsp:Transcript_764/g.1948  ORF Transcript_764/g.1948 Transcript_764/m.1948 type:complete len:206 (-) Transcript_764:333-950(-)|eukprot:CAMPEP_0118856048 /NCGR_PEP_ID=MMETSP1163-20130328/3667_1 /TAXON_ID=124430 /ORGANISM="Phaeomonas parva, Strain CCMP2877" /LENGTH=205 /DNA_ID=CAMNT_0006789071 /DNA_START=179 /DNA_END=796 /DNA_ORIENTATION=-